MRISLLSTQCNGKTTLVNDFLKMWPMYKTSKTTYRDLVSKENLPINKEATPQSQKQILQALVNEAEEASAEENIIMDRSVADNIAYSLWHYANKHEGFTDEFIIDSKHLAFKALKHIDAIFYLPIDPEIEVVEAPQRETDLNYRTEIDNIMRAMVASYEKGTGAFFPLEDCPAVITLGGPADLRLEQFRLYLKDTGKPFSEEDGSLIYT